MSLVLPENFAIVIHSFTWAGDPEPMSVTYGIDNAALGGDADDIAAEASAAFDGLLTALNPVVQFVNTDVIFQDAAPPADPTVGTFPSAVTGTATDDAIPQNTAYLVHKRSATGGRSGRGRFYLPGVGQDSVDNVGTLDPTYKSNTQTKLNTFLTDLGASAHIAGMVILHDEFGAAAADPPRAVTSLVLDNRCASQRRRLRP